MKLPLLEFKAKGIYCSAAGVYLDLFDRCRISANRYMNQKNTLERFGPVRSVTPHHVFEIAFEGIAYSKRHKGGVATRFPRILRWWKDKTIHEANSISDIKDMIT